MDVSNMYHLGREYLSVIRAFDYLLLMKFKYAWNTLNFFILTDVKGSR